MTKEEYDLLQGALSHHLNEKMLHGHLNSRERDIYKQAVLACKSVASYCYHGNFQQFKEPQHET